MSLLVVKVKIRNVVMCRTSILKLSNYFCEIPQFFNQQVGTAVYQQVQLLLQQKKTSPGVSGSTTVHCTMYIQVTVNNIFKDFLKIADPYESILFTKMFFSKS